MFRQNSYPILAKVCQNSAIVVAGALAQYGHVTRQTASTTRKKNRKKVPPCTAGEFFTLPEVDQNSWIQTTNVLSKMRSQGLSLKKAATDVGVTPQSVTAWKIKALKKRSNRSYALSQRDTLLRVMNVITAEGKREVTIRDSRKAIMIAKHSSAVHKYLQTGDASDLMTFRRRHITDAHGNRIELLTDLTTLDRLGFANELSFESLYARVA